jgi:predicted acyltransferase
MSTPAASSRIASLDQFRGYTVLGMFFVNFVGSFAAMPAIFKHHNTYCSYADTIMPQFFFAVGFTYRLTVLKRLAAGSGWAAYARAVRRNVGLILLGIVIYHLDGGATTWADLEALGVLGFLEQAFQRNVFQALVHIGVTSLWVLPVIAARPAVRVAFAFASAALHVALSHQFYYDWVMKRPGIDGGPLGFLTWTVPLVVGSLAYDATVSGRDRPIARLAGWGVVLMLVGYSMSCVNLFTPSGNVSIGPQVTTLKSETFILNSPLSTVLIEPPFVPPSRPVNYWTMSQRAGSVSYLTFGAGFSLALYAVFVWLCDVHGRRLGVFATFGTNALAGYILHDLIAEAMKPYTPKDSPLWFVLAAVAVFLGVCYLFVRYLEKNNIFLRM